jgi:hypothetical protein
MADAPWLVEAYEQPLSAIDTGVASRNVQLARTLTGPLVAWFGPQAKYVDMAGGDGLFVRLMRDAGLDFHWDDPYAANRFAQGAEFMAGASYSAVTAFEVMEHVLDPAGFVRDCLVRSGADTVIFTTELYDGEVPPEDWWYYLPEVGQHVSFATHRTMEILALDLGATFMTNGRIHVISRRRLPGWPLRIAGGRFSGLHDRLTRRRLTSLTWPDGLAAIERARQAQSSN